MLKWKGLFDYKAEVYHSSIDFKINMSKITRKIEIIPDIEGLTHDESNKKCYGAFYSFDKN